MHANYNNDGSLGERRCSTKHKLRIEPHGNTSTRRRSDDYETGVFFGGDIVDSCQEALETGNFDREPINIPDTRNNILLSMREDFLSGTSVETFQITLLNAFYDDSLFLQNKIDEIFYKRENLDADPLIQEIKDIPRTLDRLDELRSRIIPGSGDFLLIEWIDRDSTGPTVSHEIRVYGEDNDDDQYTEWAYENN